MVHFRRMSQDDWSSSPLDTRVVLEEMCFKPFSQYLFAGKGDFSLRRKVQGEGERRQAEREAQQECVNIKLMA